MIPITFNRDDLNNTKKGTVRGQDLASFLSISMPKRAGILDIFENACSVYNTVITTGFATLTLHKGYINIFGRCIYVEEGEQVQITLPSSSASGVFGIRIDLSQSGANEVSFFTKTTTLRQDNILNNEISGIYEFPLYTYSATNTTFELVNKIAPIIENISDYLNGDNFDTQNISDNSGKIATTAFVKNNLSAYLPALKPIVLQAVVKAESDDISNSVNFNGYGFVYTDIANGKKYWVGNLIGRFQAIRGFNSVGRFSLNGISISTDGVSFSKIINGGVMHTKDSASGYDGDGVGFYSSISQYDASNSNSYSYRPTNTNSSVRSGYYMTFEIVNIIMEIQ